MANERWLRNESKPAVALRTAAMAFAAHDPYSGGAEDTKGRRLNVALLKAAIAYAGSLDRNATVRVFMEKAAAKKEIEYVCNECGYTFIGRLAKEKRRVCPNSCRSGPLVRRKEK